MIQFLTVILGIAGILLAAAVALAVGWILEAVHDWREERACGPRPDWGSPEGQAVLAAMTVELSMGPAVGRASVYNHRNNESYQPRRHRRD